MGTKLLGAAAVLFVLFFCFAAIWPDLMAVPFLRIQDAAYARRAVIRDSVFNEDTAILHRAQRAFDELGFLLEIGESPYDCNSAYRDALFRIAKDYAELLADPDRKVEIYLPCTETVYVDSFTEKCDSLLAQMKRDSADWAEFKAWFERDEK